MKNNNNGRIALKFFVAMVVVLIVGWLFLQYTTFQPDYYAEKLIQAENDGNAIPIISTERQITNDQAYAIQKKYIQQKNKEIVGFKAGLTSEASQKRFNASEPVMGVFLHPSWEPNGVENFGRSYQKLMVEVEVGFIVDSDITQPIQDIQGLKQYIQYITPVIELPDLGFANKGIQTIDIIAANVCARKYIQGERFYQQDVEPNSIRVTLTRDGKIVNEGKGTDAMGDQWQALFWLVNKIIANGYTIKRGSLLITGSLGQMIPGEGGQYEADFGQKLGKIKFHIGTPKPL